MYYLFDGFTAYTFFLISQRNEKKNWQHLLKLATSSQIGNIFSNWQRLLKLATSSQIGNVFSNLNLLYNLYCINSFIFCKSLAEFVLQN